MSATEIIEQFKGLPANERAQVAKYVVEHNDSWVPESFKQGMADAAFAKWRGRRPFACRKKYGRLSSFDPRCQRQLTVQSLLDVLLADPQHADSSEAVLREAMAKGGLLSKVKSARSKPDKINCGH